MTELVWRKSSFTVNENCVEIAWRKSSRSGSDENCVEVGLNQPGFAVRDSKNPEPILEFTQPLTSFVKRLPQR